MTKRNLLHFLSPFILLVFYAPILVAQVATTGSISGAVRDETAGILPGVDITVVNLDTGSTRTTISDDEGRYRAPNLALGNYSVEASLAGFQTGVRTGIQLTLGRQAIVDITLQIGEITERVVVQGEAPLVETTSSTLSGLVDSNQIRDLPLNGRSFTQLALLQEGIGASRYLSTVQPGNEGLKISVSGTRVSQTAFLVDGSDVRNAWGTTPGSVAGVQLGVDTVQEFSVVTSAASAEYGGFSGGIINAVTRSGGNELRGSVFEYHRNSALDARNFFDRDPKDPLTRSDPPNFIRNQFGFTVGGPIVKDRTFFFGSYEGLRDRLTLTLFRTYPNEDAHNGILPPSRGGNVGVDPAVQPYLDLYPLPNSEDFGNGTGEFILTDARPTNEDYFLVKVDHTFSDSDSMFVRFTVDDAEKSNFSGIQIWREFRTSLNEYLTISEKKVLSPNLINDVRVAYVRTNADGEIESDVDPDLRFVPLDDRWHGTISIGGGVSGWGPSSLTKLHQIVNRFEVADTLFYTRGAHSIKFGIDWARLHYNFITPTRTQGQYSFSTLTDFLENQAFSFRSVVTPLIFRGIRESLVGMFIQDDYKATSNLTLNLGLRYDFHTNPTEVGGRFSNMPEVMGTTFRVGNPWLERNPSLKSFSPRIGFAWDPSGDGKMSMRGGFGIFYDLLMPPSMLGPVTTNAPWNVQVTRSNPPFPDQFQQLGDLSLCQDPATVAQCPQKLGIFGMDSPSQAYIMQYSLSLQREIAPQTMVTASYQGSQGRHLSRMTDFNSAIPQIQNGRIFFPVDAVRRNSFFDQIRFMVWDTNSFYNAFRLGLRRRFAQGYSLQGSYTYSRSVDDSSTTGAATSNSNPNGISNLPDFPQGDRSLSNFDVRNVFVFNGSWALPFGQGQRWGSNLTGLADKLLGGWQISGILNLNTGNPRNLRVRFNRSRSRITLDNADRPDLVPGANNNPVLNEGRNPNRYYDPGAFALQPEGFFGTLGRNTLIGPGNATIDFSLTKDTRLAEQTTLQFRAEFFNIANRANFSPPSTTIFSSTSGNPTTTAGRITSTTTTGRQVQFALKILF